MKNIFSYIKNDPAEAIGSICAFIFLILDFFGLFKIIPALGSNLPEITSAMLASLILANYKKYKFFTESIQQLYTEQEDVNKDHNQILTFIAENKEIFNNKEFDLYICAPITSFMAADTNLQNNIKSYKELRGICMNIKKSFEKRGIATFYKGETILEERDLDEYLNNPNARETSFEILSKSKRLIAILPNKKLISSIYIEIGYALAKKIPCRIYYDKSIKHIPNLLRHAAGGIGNYEGMCIARIYTKDNILDIIDEDFTKDIMKENMNKAISVAK